MRASAFAFGATGSALCALVAASRPYDAGTPMAVFLAVLLSHIAILAAANAKRS